MSLLNAALERRGYLLSHGNRSRAIAGNVAIDPVGLDGDRLGCPHREIVHLRCRVEVGVVCRIHEEKFRIQSLYGE